MREFFVIKAVLSYSYWWEGKGRFASTLYMTKYRTPQEALTAARKIPEDIIFSIEPMYVNERKKGGVRFQ